MKNAKLKYSFYRRVKSADILPHLTLAQVYDALSYYEDHREMIDQLLQQQTPALWRDHITQQLGKEKAQQLLGYDA